MLSRCCFAILLLTTALIARADDDSYGDPLPKGAKMRLGTIRYRFGSTQGTNLSADGKTIYLSDTWELRRYDSAGAALKSMPRETPREGPAAFSADGKRAVTGGSTTVVWDTATGKAIVTIKRSGAFFSGGQALADISADGKVVAIGAIKYQGKDADVLVWDVDGNKEISRFEPPHNEHALVALSADGKIVAVWGRHSSVAGKPRPNIDPASFVDFYDAATGKLLSKVRAQAYSPSAVALSVDGLAAVGGTNGVEVVDPKTGASRHLLLGRSGVGRSLAFSPDGTTLFAASNVGVVQRWRVADGARLSTTEPPMPELQYCTLRATGPNRAVALARRSNTLIVWEAPSGKLLGPQDGHFSAVPRVTVTADSKFVLTSGSDGQVLKWELATGKLMGRAPGHPWPGREDRAATAALYAPDGGRALVADGYGYGVHDLPSGMQQFSIPYPFSGFHRVAFTADASKVVLAAGTYLKGDPTVVSVWDLATAKRIFQLDVPDLTLVDAALTRDGKHLVTAGRKPAAKSDGEFFITAWEFPSGTKKSEYRGAGGYSVAHVAPAHDNTTAAVLNADRKLLRFDIATGKATPVAGGLNYNAASPVFSPDGKSLALLGPTSFGDPAPMAVLDWETGKARQTFTCPDGGPLCAAFSPDGRYLVTGNLHGTAFVWELNK